MVKNPPANAGDMGWEDCLEKEMATLLQYSCPGNPVDRGTWPAMVYGVAKSQTHLSNSTTTATIPSKEPRISMEYGRSFGEESKVLWKHIGGGI